MKLTPTRTFALLAPALLVAACASKQPAPEAPLTPYTCDGTYTSLTADYYNNDGRTHYVILTVGETKHKLTNTISASGARYANARHTPAETGSLVWWTKGPEGILYEVTARSNGSAYERQLATCTSQPRLLKNEELPRLQPLNGSIPGTAPGGYYAPQPEEPATTTI
ncbi:MAG: hypothetical protein DI585_02215 [Pseudomonas fluorescens]|nr:MAG: hypothetical protein DI585_02215 [Pseudomonas fluorescens]